MVNSLPSKFLLPADPGGGAWRQTGKSTPVDESVAHRAGDGLIKVNLHLLTPNVGTLVTLATSARMTSKDSQADFLKRPLKAGKIKAPEADLPDSSSHVRIRQQSNNSHTP